MHKGEGEVVTVEVEVDPERYAKYQRLPQMPAASTDSPNLNSFAVTNSSSSLLNSHNLLLYQNSPNNTDASGNKKFCCNLCPYRSNWKADMYRHLRKRHERVQPRNEDMRVMSAEEAANTLDAYERMHGVNVRKRARIDLSVLDSIGPMTPSPLALSSSEASKRFKVKGVFSLYRIPKTPNH